MKAKLVVFVVSGFMFGLCNCSYFNHYEQYDGKSIRFIGDDLIDKMNQSEFGYLEDYFDYLIDQKKSSYNGTRLLEELYDYIGMKRNVKKALDKWCSLKEAHHSAYVLRGFYWIHHAWRARGSGFANTVTEKGWKLFSDRLKNAREDLEIAHAMNSSDPNSATAMITVCMGLKEDESTMEEWYQKAIAADSCSFFPYHFKFTFLDPKWRGTHAKQYQFAQSCFQNSPEGSIAYTILVNYIEGMADKSNNQSSFYQNPKTKTFLSDVLKKWLAEHPDSVRARYSQAKMYYYLGKREKSVESCSKALLVEPNNPYILFLRSVNYFSYGRPEYYQKTKNDLLIAIKYDKYNDKMYNLLSRCLFVADKNYNDAEKYITKAIELNSDEKEYYLSRGMLRKRMHKYEGALEDFSMAIEIDPSWEVAYRYRKDCYQEMGDVENVRKDSEIVKEMSDKRQQTKIISMLKSSGATKYFKTQSPLDLSFLDSLPLRLARLLSDHGGHLYLNGLKEMTPDVADCLGHKQHGTLYLEGIEALSEDVAERLCRKKKYSLHLGIVELTPELASILGKRVKMLHLPKLKRLSPAAAVNLSQGVSYLFLNGVETLDPETAKGLGRVKKQLHLKGLEELSPDAAVHLVGVEDCIVLDGVQTLSPETADRLAHAKGGLILNGLENLPLETAERLVEAKGILSLDGLKTLSPEMAKVLASHRAPVSLGGLETLPLEIARQLAIHRGRLSLNGMASLSPEVEDCLSRHEGPVYYRGGKTGIVKKE